MLVMYFYETILAVRLTTYMHLPEEKLGFFFCLPSVAYAISCLLNGYLAERFQNRSLITIGFIFGSIACALLGPSSFLELP